tara:strand:+ start:51 stop:245 length:195 start_codon:yes stop_codon:yes gene_type:complete
MTTKKELEAALKACVDLLEDIRQGLNSPVYTQINNLYNWHPLIKKVGGHYWYWDAKDECWTRDE